jgi:NADH:ubiquinone oxidoreductase subunit 2 (subunit N)
LSIISIFYYIRLTKLMFFNRTRNWIFLEPPSRLLTVVLGCVLVINLVFWLKPVLFLNLIYNISFYFYD